VKMRVLDVITVRRTWRSALRRPLRGVWTVVRRVVRGPLRGVWAAFWW
jgi:hypothetical protein